VLTVRGTSTSRIGDLAFDHGIRIHELAPHQASLEEAFMEMTKDDVEYRAVSPQGPQSPHLQPANPYAQIGA
jgi:ABC-2 type transport system ATP-binding protein